MTDYIKYLENELLNISDKIKINKPNHYKRECQCELCFIHSNLILTKEIIENQISLLLNNNEKQ